MAKVLIIGASRGIGLEAVKAVLKAGHSVRALARSVRRIRVEHPQLEKMAGDALEMATVTRALTGIDVVTHGRKFLDGEPDRVRCGRKATSCFPDKMSPAKNTGTFIPDDFEHEIGTNFLVKDALTHRVALPMLPSAAQRYRLGAAFSSVAYRLQW